MFPTQKSPKISAKFYCEKCNYKCCKQSEYNKHILTNKHKILQNPTSNPTSEISNKTYDCICGKIYKHTSTLYAHKKKCIVSINNNNNKEIQIENNGDILNNMSDKDLIMMLVKQNTELLEVIKNGTHNNNNNNNNNNTNSHNKTFNLQFFLNEECKDALNISEFVSSIKVQLEDLETTGRLGYVEGVSRIINKNLNDLDQTKRPIHCSDAKREVLYIKNDDQWIKENETKPILTKAIKQIANENIKQISEWRKKYPDCTDSESRKNDLYLNIVSNAMSGSTTEEQTSNYEKIITKVAKEVVIEK